MFMLCFIPLFLVFSFFINFRGNPPALKDLQQILRELDEECYQASGCLELPAVIARCEQYKASCSDKYYYELRTLNRNCRELR